MWDKEIFMFEQKHASSNLQEDSGYTDVVKLNLSIAIPGHCCLPQGTAAYNMPMYAVAVSSRCYVLFLTPF